MGRLRIWFRRINRACTCGRRGHGDTQDLLPLWKVGWGQWVTGRNRAPLMLIPIRWFRGEVWGSKLPMSGLGQQLGLMTWIHCCQWSPEYLGARYDLGMTVSLTTEPGQRKNCSYLTGLTEMMHGKCLAQSQVRRGCSVTVGAALYHLGAGSEIQRAPAAYPVSHSQTESKLRF